MYINGSKCFYSVENGEMTIGNQLFSKTISDISFATVINQTDSLSVPFFTVLADRNGEKLEYRMWEDLPILYMPHFSDNNLLTLKSEHWILKNVKLHAFTDDHDTLTTENEYGLFRMMLDTCNGEIFILENPEDGKGIVIISETPDYQTASLTVKDGIVNVENGGNGLALGFCKMGECEALCREYYRHARAPKELVTMSNTWGDCNGFSRVCQEFALKEVDAARELGVDIVQIDDGWQTGSTADTTRRDCLGRREFYGDFWDLDYSRFPDTLKIVSDYAANDGIKVGMWFAPESHDGFALLDRDIAILKKAYDEWGIRFFKLDMYWIESDTDRDRFLKLLSEIYAFGDDVAVQLDVTRYSRINYLCGRQYGTVFVENRYTKTHNSFPHRILRNLWMIGKYIPTSKFQFELVNPELNKEEYAPADPFAPSLYDMDYLFATVMLSNPLFWMEMQFLPEARRERLKYVMDIWKQHRSVLSKADVKPIGDKPSGRSFTGFYVSRDNKPEYLLLFREVTEESETVIKCPGVYGNTEILASNTNVTVEIKNGCIHAAFSKPRSYAFVKLN